MYIKVQLFFTLLDDNQVDINHCQVLPPVPDPTLQTLPS